MNTGFTAPTVLDYGERYGKLTVLERLNNDHGTKYRCGCTCGYQKVMVRANALMKGTVKSCRRCK